MLSPACYRRELGTVDIITGAVEDGRTAWSTTSCLGSRALSERLPLTLTNKPAAVDVNGILFRLMAQLIFTATSSAAGRYARSPPIGQNSTDCLEK